MEENEELLENSMVLQEVPQHNFEAELEYKEKTEEAYFDEELLQQLEEIRDTAQMNLAVREGYKDYEVINVINYNKDVELIAIETEEVEYLDLSVVIAQNPDTLEIVEIYYLDGEEADIGELNSKYKSSMPIIKLINDTKENLKLNPDKQDEELIKIELIDLEERNKEKNIQKNNDETKEIKEQEEREEQEEHEEEKEKQADEEKNEEELTGTKPKYMVQTIDVDKTYVDDKTTVRNAFKIPHQVKYLAVAKPMQEDENVLSKNLTIYMLDSSSRVIEEDEGIKIDDIFEIDGATGTKPMSDENTKIELGGYAERNKNHTMARFVSKENPNMHLSVEDKKIGDYAQVYAGRKTMDGNDAVEVQLETRNVPIQTSLEMQKIASGYKGIYNIENIDKEVDDYEEQGKDLEKIQKENADGKENKIQGHNTPYIPGTEITWEELAEETGESIPKLQDRFERELANGKEPNDIIDEIEYDYEMTGHEHEHTLF